MFRLLSRFTKRGTGSRKWKSLSGVEVMQFEWQRKCCRLQRLAVWVNVVVLHITPTDEECAATCTSLQKSGNNANRCPHLARLLTLHLIVCSFPTHCYKPGIHVQKLASPSPYIDIRLATDVQILPLGISQSSPTTLCTTYDDYRLGTECKVAEAE